MEWRKSELARGVLRLYSLRYSGWANSSVRNYSAVLAASVFCPAPAGDSAETFRLNAPPQGADPISASPRGLELAECRRVLRRALH